MLSIIDFLTLMPRATRLFLTHGNHQFYLLQRHEAGISSCLEHPRNKLWDLAGEPVQLHKLVQKGHNHVNLAAAEYSSHQIKGYQLSIELAGIWLFSWCEKYGKNPLSYTQTLCVDVVGALMLLTTIQWFSAMFNT